LIPTDVEIEAIHRAYVTVVLDLETRLSDILHPRMSSVDHSSSDNEMPLIYHNNRGMQTRNWMKNLVIFVLALMLSFVLLEYGLRVFTPFPISRSSNSIFDPVLGHRMDPGMRGIDSAGFRNPESLATADIVAIGDSQTYGYNVHSHDAWPRKLAGMTGKSVYNFGVGNYGILQYIALMDKAIQMRPEYIIIGLYLANDLDDVHKLIRKNNNWRRWKDDFLKTHTLPHDFSFKNDGEEMSTRHEQSLEVHEKVAVLSLCRYFAERHFTPKIAAQNRTNMLIIDEENLFTLMKHERVRRHAKFMDLERPNIAFALEITQVFLEDAKKRCDEKNIRLFVLFIPSKEDVLYNYLLSRHYTLIHEYHTEIRSEENLKKRLMEFMDKSEILYADAKPLLARAIEQESKLYPMYDDGHPYERGQQLYAEAVQRTLFRNIN
jgi:lysophospholipase L1-like esterase